MKNILKYKNFSVNENLNVDIDLPNDIIEISNAYIKAGKEVFVVGGAIRDYIQGKSPKDWDIVTNALPEESKQILKGFNVSDEQGKNFGVLRVFTKDEPLGYEIASYRKDIASGRDTKGDDEKVEIGEHITMADDASRRDLTMNALFYDIGKKEIIDLVGGIDDIKNGVVKAVGDASVRFIEDRLRICRVFRFAARTGGDIDPATADAIRKDNRLRGVGPKDDVSQERIWEEFNKAWSQVKDYNDYLNLFTEFDMWGEVFHGSDINTDNINTNSLNVSMANLFRNENPNRLRNKLVGNYKIDGSSADTIVFLLNFKNLTEENGHKMKEALDEKNKDVENIKLDDIQEWIRVERLGQLHQKFLQYRAKRLGDELIEQGWKQGPKLGQEIRRRSIEDFKQFISNR